MEENFIKYIEQSIKDHWDLPALTDFKGSYQFLQRCSP